MGWKLDHTEAFHPTVNPVYEKNKRKHLSYLYNPEQ